MIAEHDVVTLTKDLPGLHLRAGDTGVVVAIHSRPGEAAPIGYALEIFGADGETIDVLDVDAEAVSALATRTRTEAMLAAE